MQHGQQHRQSVLVQSQCHAPRIAQRRLIDQRLHLHQQRPRAFARDHHRAAGGWRGMRGQENRRRVGHLAQALVRHREHAQFVHRAKAVLERAQHTEATAGLALEIQHGVDHVFEHARTGDAAFLGHVADQEHGRSRLLGKARELGRRLAHLADRAWRRRQQFGPDGLDGVDHQHPRAQRRRLLQDALDTGFRQRLQRFQRQAQTLRARRHLRQRFLAGDVHAGQLRTERAQHLQQQGRLADARVTTDQHHRALHQAAAQHAIELADAGGHARLGGQRNRRQRRDPRRTGGIAGVVGALRAHRSHHRRSRRQHDRAQRVPHPALDALPLPLAVLGAALGADVGGFRFGHEMSLLFALDALEPDRQRDPGHGIACPSIIHFAHASWRPRCGPPAGRG